MSTFVEHLERFNRKERFYAISLALGLHKWKWAVSERLQKGIEEKLGITVPVTA